MGWRRRLLGAPGETQDAPDHPCSCCGWTEQRSVPVQVRCSTLHQSTIGGPRECGTWVSGSQVERPGSLSPYSTRCSAPDWESDRVLSTWCPAFKFPAYSAELVCLSVVVH